MRFGEAGPVSVPVSVRGGSGPGVRPPCGAWRVPAGLSGPGRREPILFETYPYFPGRQDHALAASGPTGKRGAGRLAHEGSLERLTEKARFPWRPACAADRPGRRVAKRFRSGSGEVFHRFPGNVWPDGPPGAARVQEEVRGPRREGGCVSGYRGLWQNHQS